MAIALISAWVVVWTLAEGADYISISTNNKGPAQAEPLLLVTQGILPCGRVNTGPTHLS